MSITVSQKAKVTADFRRDAKDTGSPEVQCAVLTERIKNLTEHLKAHPKDYATQRGLLGMVSKRSRLLRYVQRVDAKGYTTLCDRLGLRK